MDEEAVAEPRKVKKISLMLGKKRGRPPKRKARTKHQPAALSEADAVRRRRRSEKAREAQLRAFGDPAYRARNRKQIEALHELQKQKPWLFSRLGVPDGWTRAEARLQRTKDEAAADALIERMSKLGMI